MKELQFISRIHGSMNIKIDDDNESLINSFKWYIHKGRKTFYLRNSKHQYLHRIISNPSDKEITDHIDGNGLNNQRNNLRNVSHQQNIVNSGKRKHNTSGYKGVGKRGNRWSASIHNNYTKIHIGYYDTAIQAANAYNNKAIHIYGDKANLNEISERE